jgi:hypothetical protein
MKLTTTVTVEIAQTEAEAEAYRAFHDEPLTLTPEKVGLFLSTGIEEIVTAEGYGQVGEITVGGVEID